MAVIGELPPTSAKGQNFVTDPRILNNKETKGQIRLHFDSADGRKVSVIRSFQVCTIRDKRGQRFAFKALDQMLTFFQKDGTSKSLSNKCMDINVATCSMFGISRGVVENVIFCHQEDSNWPLADTLTLKKKFDDLFGSVRYTKVLENLNTLRNKHLKRLKEQQSAAALLRQDFEQLKILVRRLNDCKAKLCHLEERSKICQEKKEELSGCLERLQAEYAQVRGSCGASEEELHFIENLLDQRQSKTQALREAIPQPCPETLDQLKQVRLSLQAEGEQDRASKDEAQGKFNEAVADLEAISESQKVLAKRKLELAKLESSLAYIVNEQLEGFKDLWRIFQSMEEAYAAENRTQMEQPPTLTLSYAELEKDIANGDGARLALFGEQCKQLSAVLQRSRARPIREERERLHMDIDETQKQINQLDTEIQGASRRIADLRVLAAPLKNHVDNYRKASQQMQAVKDNLTQVDAQLAKLAGAGGSKQSMEQMDEILASKGQYQNDYEEIRKAIEFADANEALTSQLESASVACSDLHRKLMDTAGKIALRCTEINGLSDALQRKASSLQITVADAARKSEQTDPSSTRGSRATAKGGKGSSTAGQAANTGKDKAVALAGQLVKDIADVLQEEKARKDVLSVDVGECLREHAYAEARLKQEREKEEGIGLSLATELAVLGKYASKNASQIVESAKAACDAAKRDVAVAQYGSRVYTECLKSSKSRNACVFCLRSFVSAAEIDAMEDGLRKKLEAAPKQLATNERKANEAEERLMEVTKLKGSFDRCDRLRAEANDCKVAIAEWTAKEIRARTRRQRSEAAAETNWHLIESLTALCSEGEKFEALQAEMQATKERMIALEAERSDKQLRVQRLDQRANQRSDSNATDAGARASLAEKRSCKRRSRSSLVTDGMSLKELRQEETRIRQEIEHLNGMEKAVMHQLRQVESLQLEKQRLNGVLQHWMASVGNVGEGDQTREEALAAYEEEAKSEEERKTSLTTEMNRLRAKLKGSQAALDAVAEKALELEKSMVQESVAIKNLTDSQRMSHLTSERQKLERERTTTGLKSSRGKGVSLVEEERRLVEMERDLKELVDGARNALTALNERIEHRQSMVLEAEQNIQLKELETEVAALQARRAQIRAERGSDMVTIDAARAKLQTAESELARLNTEAATLEGGSKSTCEWLESIRREIGLSSSSASKHNANPNPRSNANATAAQKRAGDEGKIEGRYKDLGRRLRQSKIQLQLTETLVKDLKKYYVALDGALMEFHSTKMREINASLMTYWKCIYTGLDIDYIAIRSSADASEPTATESGSDAGAVAASRAAGTRGGTRGAATNADADTAIGTTTAGAGSRSYNYRVVSGREELEMDLRGRCSAGQRVLACLAIRLALAESFASACGIFTLDEPTTNLDRPNVEALALALSNLIKSRKHLANFQLILITHDEQFVEALRSQGEAEKYLTVYKDRKTGFSKIKTECF